MKSQAALNRRQAQAALHRRRRTTAKHGQCFWCGRFATYRCDRCAHWLCAPSEGCSRFRKLPNTVSRWQLLCAWPCRTRRPETAVRVARGGAL